MDSTDIDSINIDSINLIDLVNPINRAKPLHPAKAMEPFIHLLPYPFVICAECGFACIADKVHTHLRPRHRHVIATRRSAIAAAVQAIPGILRNQIELQGFQLPPPDAKAIPHIPVFEDGLRCDKCGLIRRTARGIAGRSTDG